MIEDWVAPSAMICYSIDAGDVGRHLLGAFYRWCGTNVLDLQHFQMGFELQIKIYYNFNINTVVAIQ